MKKTKTPERNWVGELATKLADLELDALVPVRPQADLALVVALRAAVWNIKVQTLKHPDRYVNACAMILGILERGR